jgi:excisionase family DNA binding protein
MHSPFSREPSPQPTTPLALRPVQAARTLGISKSTLDRLTKSGEITCFRIARAKMYAFEELRRWLTEKTEEARVQRHLGDEDVKTDNKN